MEITILGRIPSKKNSRRPFIRGGRVMNFPSKDYVEWHKIAELQILAKGIPEKPYENITAHITIYAPDKRASDLTNKAESIMDLLVDTGVIKDDNWFVCPLILLQFGGVDKENPRAIVKLSPLPS